MTVFAPLLSFIWDSAKNFGLDPGELFSEAGIDPALRMDINARISGEKLDLLTWIAMQKSNDEAFVFHLTEHLHPSYLGVMGYAWLASANLREAFERLSRYQKVISDTGFIQLEDQGDTLCVHVEYDAPALHDPNLRELMRLTNAVKLCRMNAGESFQPKKVQFKQPEPDRAAAYYSFFHCELEFDSDSSTLQIDREAADRPLSGANAQLETLFEQQIVEYLARLDKDDIIGRTQAAIFKQLPSGRASIEEIAGKLGTSTRTLRRKLKDAGTSYKDLLAETRQELGKRYIRDKSLSLTEVAFMLGFSDSSSFSRAFRGWTGQSPSAFRVSP
jgi:AraC-like DNA-binding protein